MISPKPFTLPLQIDSWRHPSNLTFKREQRAYRPERKPVTIATGFIYDGGMLFCADTKITDVIKTNESKIEHCRSENGDCSITFAMSSDDMNFPRMAVLKCWEYVRKMDFSSVTIDAVHNMAEFSLAWISTAKS